MESSPSEKQDKASSPGAITAEEAAALRAGSGFLYRFLEHFEGGVALLQGDVLKAPQVLYLNRNLTELTGLSADTLTAGGLSALHWAVGHRRTGEHLAKAVAEQRAVRLEALLSRPERADFWATVELYCEDREAGIWVLKIEDISARKMREDGLGRDQERFAVAMRSLEEGVVLVGARQEIDFMNYEAERLTGLRLTSVTGRLFSDTIRLVGHDDERARNCPVKMAFRTGKRVGPLADLLLVSVDGTEHRVSCLCVPMMDSRGAMQGAVFIFRDISSQSMQEAELRKVQKMESIALLADGIAHDFNNILTGILGNLSLARSCSGEGTRVAGILHAAEKAASRAKDLTHRLAQFSRGGTSVTSTVSLKDLIRECTGFILSGSNCRCRTEIADSLWPAEVDEGQISQVLNNLLINATQAMPGGGTVTVSAGNIELGESSSIPLKPGAYVRVIVRDQGHGIQPESLTRIFDPYYTTKKSGTGLGLATSYSIIKGHHGYITVDSEVGRGTVFSFYLPALPASVSTKLQQDEARLYHGKGRLLVMDDEAMIQQITGDMLTHLGYEVHFARDGMETLERCRQAVREGNPFDALLLDLTVPGGMGGKETLEALRDGFPDVCAIVSSGYGGSPVIRDYRDYGFSGAICKPYTIQELSRVVNEALARKAG